MNARGGKTLWSTNRKRSRKDSRVASHSSAWAVFGADAARSAASTDEPGVRPSVLFSSRPAGMSERPERERVGRVDLPLRSGARRPRSCSSLTSMQRSR